MDAIYNPTAAKRHKYRNVDQLSQTLKDSLLLEDLWLLHYFQMLNPEMIKDLAALAKVTPIYLQQLLNRNEVEVKARQTPKIMDVEVINNGQPVQPENSGSQVP
jgi:hypothetical protein